MCICKFLDSCFVSEVNSACEASCSNPLQYKPDEFGICRFIEDCSGRGYNESSLLPCGSDCYGKEDTKNCIWECDNSAHYIQNEEKKSCDLKYVYVYIIYFFFFLFFFFRPCIEREINTSVNLYCGSNCFVSEKSESCVEQCDGSTTYTIDEHGLFSV
jgi:hypothetical protein